MKPGRVPVKFEGGCVTEKLAAAVAPGFSMCQNIRQGHPGHIQRKGMAKLHATADGTNRPIKEFQFTDRGGNTHFLAQMSDGDILLSGDAPPTVGSGVFGTELFSGNASPKPASFAVVDDLLFFSTGVDQHQVWVGQGRPVESFIVINGTGALPAVPDEGKDYSREVADGRSDTVAVLDSLDTLANHDCVLIRTAVPRVKSFGITVSAANGTTAAIALKKFNGAWTAVVEAQLVLSGTYKWTASGSGTNEYYCEANAGGDPSLSEPSTLLENGVPMTAGALGSLAASEWGYGDNDTLGYSTVYVRLSDGTDPDVKADGYVSVGVTDGTQSSGKTIAQTGDVSLTAPTDVIPRLACGECGFWWMLHVSAALDAEVEISAVTYEADPQPMVNVWDGVPVPVVEAIVYDGVTYKSYSADTVIVSEEDENTKIYFSTPDKIEAVYVNPGSTPNTGDATAVDGFGKWTGAGWSETAPTSDGTAGFSKPGWIVVGRQDTAQPTQFEDNKDYRYWWYITVDDALSADMYISIEVQPYFDIDEFGQYGNVCCAWKDRLAVSFNLFPKDVYITEKNAPMCFNWDAGNITVLQPGDGRPNAVTCMLSFFNELMVFQEEKGTDGGCITLFQGESSGSFGPLILSTDLGTFNSKSAVIVEGAMTSLSTTRPVAKLVFFVSRVGSFATDGQDFFGVSDDIKNYFDPKEASTCIRNGYEKEHWIGYDSADNVVRMGMVTGASATVPNIFPVYDPADITGHPWTFDVLGYALSSFAEISGGGDAHVIQVGGIAGYVVRLNTTTNDIDAAISSYSQFEIGAGGEEFDLTGAILRMKAQSAGNLTITPYENGVAGTAQTESMVVSSGALKRALLRFNVRDSHVSLKFANAVASQEISLLDMILFIREIQNR